MIRLEFLCSHKFVKYVKDRYIERCFNDYTNNHGIAVKSGILRKQNLTVLCCIRNWWLLPSLVVMSMFYEKTNMWIF